MINHATTQTLWNWLGVSVFSSGVDGGGDGGAGGDGGGVKSFSMVSAMIGS